MNFEEDIDLLKMDIDLVDMSSPDDFSDNWIEFKKKFEKFCDTILKNE